MFYVHSLDGSTELLCILATDRHTDIIHCCCFASLLTVFGTLLVHGWYSLGRHVTIGTPMVIFAVLTVF